MVLKEQGPSIPAPPGSQLGVREGGQGPGVTLSGPAQALRLAQKHGVGQAWGVGEGAGKQSRAQGPFSPVEAGHVCACALGS